MFILISGFLRDVLDVMLVKYSKWQGCTL